MSIALSHLQVVWFRRDLRIHDHAPLTQASLQGPVLPLYIAEPALWAEPDASGRQWRFVRDSLTDLRDTLERIGQTLIVRQGDAAAVLADIMDAYGGFTLWSHEEGGNGWMRARDAAVRRWCRDRRIVWHELPQPGVIRALRGPAGRSQAAAENTLPLRHRDPHGWAQQWEQQIHLAPLSISRRLEAPRLPGGSPIPGSALPALRAFDPAITPSAASDHQPGGRVAGLALLTSFLEERATGYCADRSDPVASEIACSRLSPHLSFGTLSVREVAHACFGRLAALEGQPEAERRRWSPAIKAVVSRLGWRARCLQILEDDPQLEFRARHPEAGEPAEADRERLGAFAAGETGVPLVDAAIHALNRTGWVNFRLRSLLASFACHQLGLPWRAPALVLARQFTDYEPAIYYAQMQIQAGVAGLPPVQPRDPEIERQRLDPDGRFVGRWLDGRTPAARIVDPAVATALARERLADRPPPAEAPPVIGARARLRLRRPESSLAQLQLPL